MALPEAVLAVVAVVVLIVFLVVWIQKGPPPPQLPLE